MTTMIREIYEALKEAGASEEKATAAASVLLGEFLHRGNTGELATQSDLRELGSGLHELEGGVRELETSLREKIGEEIAGVREEIGGVRLEIGGVRGEVQNLDKRLAVVERELEIIRWIVGGVGFGVLLLVIRSFWP
ncbi:MAG: hypothetical protein ACREV4_11730, partial [Gammaproteobacteria bacterium]